ncbi:MAG: 3 family protein [Bacteroidota bacterium]|nr:3 family protein [Bacteroidota bacterium]
MAEENYKHSEITEKVIEAFYKVYNTLGYGFLEKVYENAMVIELKKMGLDAVAQHPISVFYSEKEVGVYFADLLVEDCVLVELKTAKDIATENEAQLINYLKATKIEIGLLMNFGKTPHFKKRAYSNEFKA